MAQLKAQIDQSSLRRLLKNINKYGKHIKKQVQDEITYTAQQIRMESIQAAPYRTGNLKKSAYVNHKRNRLGAEIGHNANYASFVEFGTSKQREQPYLMPAFERNSKKMKAEILKIVKNRKKPFRPR